MSVRRSGGVWSVGEDGRGMSMPVWSNDGRRDVEASGVSHSSKCVVRKNDGGYGARVTPEEDDHLTVHGSGFSDIGRVDVRGVAYIDVLRVGVEHKR